MEDPCSLKCTFTNCVDQLNFVITKGTLSQIKQYVNDNCFSALQRFDCNGRTPLHMAASCGKVDVVKWLLDVAIKTKIIYSMQTYIDLKDVESGWTALHKAVYYGRVPCVMELIKNGANMWIKDDDGCNILNIMTLDVSPWCYDPIVSRSSETTLESWSGLKNTDATELYTWGVNENMTLAHGNQKSRKIPEVVEFFARDKISIKQVVMCKFHSVFLTHDGRVYSCGNGRGGRLGIGQEDVFIQPQLVNLSEVVVKIAASVDHTVFITEEGQVFVCGMNTFRTLGINPPPEKCLLPARVFSLKDHKIIGCCTGPYHTVVWTGKNALYTFGTNAGQLGHAKGDVFIIQPRQVSGVHKEGDQITCVNTCDSATVVATQQGTVYLLHKYICRKIVTKQTDILKLQVGGGKLDNSVVSQVKPIRLSNKSKEKNENEKDNVKVLILKNSGNLLSWSSIHTTLDRCQLDTKQIKWVSDISMCENGSSVLIISAEGSAYLTQYSSWQAGKSLKKNLTSQNREFSNSLDLFKSESVQKLKCDQLPCAFRTHSGVLGPKGRNLAILQSDPCNFITKIPSIDDTCSMVNDLKAFWKQSNIRDRLHNVQIHLKRANKPDIVHPAHQFILGNRSHVFSKFFSENALTSDCPMKCIIVIENVYPFILSNVMEFIYTGSCELLQMGSNVGKDLDYLGTPKVFCKHTGHDLLSGATGKTKQLFVNSQKKCRIIDLFKQVSLLFAIKDLTELFFNKININDGIILSIHQNSLSKMQFSPHFLSSLCNCDIECDDGISFKAHKSILAARIPFFQGMLLSPWMESNLGEQNKIAHLKVPVPSDVFRYLLNFAYSDSPTCLDTASSVESLCEVLAASDLLLVDRLKQVTETWIVPLLTLKNVVLVTDVAVAFNSKQLHKTCLQFACQNLPALLHTPIFHSADQDMLEELENTYRKEIKAVYNRSLPASLMGPNIDHYLDLNDDDNFNEQDKNFSNFSVSSSPKKTSSIKHRRKSHKKEFGVMLSDLLNKSTKTEEEEIVDRIMTNAPEENDANNNISMKHKSSHKDLNKTEKIKASDNLIKEPKKSTFVKQEQPTPVDLKTTSIKPINIPPRKNNGYENIFPSLGLQKGINIKSPDSKMIYGASGKMPFSSKSHKKLSQKERRRLQEKVEEESKEQVIPTSPPNAWGVQPIISPVTQTSIWETPEKSGVILPQSPPKTLRVINSNVNNNGPWQSISTNFASSPPSNHSIFAQTSPKEVTHPTSLLDVIESEQINQEHSEKSSKKPLSVIQIEDQAMEELKMFYEKKHQKSSDIFIVSRVSYDAAKLIANQRKTITQKNQIST